MNDFRMEYDKASHSGNIYYKDNSLFVRVSSYVNFSNQLRFTLSMLLGEKEILIEHRNKYFTLKEAVEDAKSLLVGYYERRDVSKEVAAEGKRQISNYFRQIGER